MKLFAKLMLAAMVLAVLAPFTILKDEYGKPLMSFGDLKIPELAVPDMQEIKDVTDDLPGSSGQNTVIYQWTDASGNLHFTTEEPPEGVEFTVKSYNPQANVIQAVKPKAEAVAATGNTEGAGEDGNQGDTDGNIGNPYSPEKIEKLFDDARKVQQQLNERALKQQQVIDNL